MNIQKLIAPKLGSEIFSDEPIMTDAQKMHRSLIISKGKRHFVSMKYFDNGGEDETDSVLVEFANLLEEYPIEAVRFGFDEYSKTPRLSERGNPQAPSPFDIRSRIQKKIDDAKAKTNKERRIDMVVHHATGGNLPTFISDGDLFLALAVNAIDFETIANCKRSLPSYTQDRVQEIREEAGYTQTLQIQAAKEVS